MLAGCFPNYDAQQLTSHFGRVCLRLGVLCVRLTKRVHYWVYISGLCWSVCMIDVIVFHIWINSMGSKYGSTVIYEGVVVIQEMRGKSLATSYCQ